MPFRHKSAPFRADWSAVNACHQGGYGSLLTAAPVGHFGCIPCRASASAIRHVRRRRSMFRRFIHSAAILAAAVCAPALIAHLVVPTGAAENALSQQLGDDGWRLTRQGWVQLSPRVIRSESEGPSLAVTPDDMAVTAVTASGRQSRWELHPAALALLIGAAAIGAFCLFPNKRQTASQ
jgi:hypothetical protein